MSEQEANTWFQRYCGQREEINRLRAEHERAVQLCLQHSIATGHAETANQLMSEVMTQVKELRAEVKRRGKLLLRAQLPLEDAKDNYELIIRALENGCNRRVQKELLYEDCRAILQEIDEMVHEGESDVLSFRTP